MFSIIICSISPERLKSLTANISSTIGVQHEIIAIDNREKKWPIAKAYNYGAAQAKYPYLFFVHEDVKFHSIAWGSFVQRKLQEPNCGVVGFAGGKVMLKSYSGWNQYWEWVCCYLYQDDNGVARFDVSNAYLEHPFEEVVTLDGLGMFVRKELWKQHPFDETLLTGFHCYDIDFSLQIICGGRYKNYVCCSNQVLIEHFSKGTYNKEWYADTIRLYKCKWSKILPVKVYNYRLTDKEIQKHTERLAYDFLKQIFRSNVIRTNKWLVLIEFWKRPLSWKHLRRCISYTFRYWINN